MSARILQGNVFDVLPTVAAGSIDCVVTSPPYWMLRSYLKADHPLKPLELGSEATPQQYVANQVKVMRLVRDALADHGTVWLNIGDTYTHARGKRKPGDKHGPKQLTNAGSYAMPSATVDGVKESNLCLIPWRLAIALQDDGWIVRSVIVWHKPAPMPASLSGWQWRRCRVKVKGTKQPNRADAERGRYGTIPQANGGSCLGVEVAEWTDCPGCPKCKPTGGYVLRRGSWRPTSSWEPVLMLAKSPAYYCDGEAVKSPATSATMSRNEYTRVIDDPDEQFAVKHDHETTVTTANLRDVWKIAAEPLKEKHYAAFPTELVHRCLKAGTSARGYCPHCGGPWCRVINAASVPHPQPRRSAAAVARASGNGRNGGGNQANGSASLAPVVEIAGWRPSCTCPAHEPRPGRVLDLFAGSGRTGREAMRLGLDFVGVELNPEYAAMARRILRNESPLFSGITT